MKTQLAKRVRYEIKLPNNNFPLMFNYYYRKGLIFTFYNILQNGKEDKGTAESFICKNKEEADSYMERIHRNEIETEVFYIKEIENVFILDS